MYCNFCKYPWRADYAIRYMNHDARINELQLLYCNGCFQKHIGVRLEESPVKDSVFLVSKI